jgi:peptidoglycan/xylan/chitin deacetylase (PgdA/CDA1 family)
MLDHFLTSASRRGVKAAAILPGMFTRRRPGDLIILLYHRVGAGNREIDLPAEAFARQISELVERDRVLSLAKSLSDGRSGGVVLSFDDGYRDFHEHVLPILVRHQVPAILYLATGLVEGESHQTSEALTWAQLTEATDTGLVTIGAHTHTHVNVSRLTEAAAETEMRRSKELIEDRLGQPCTDFAYPFAVTSPEADRAARRLFSSAALDGWRTNRRDHIDPYRLGRTPILQSDGSLFFRAKVLGWLDAEALAYRALGRGPWRET